MRRRKRVVRGLVRGDAPVATGRTGGGGEVGGVHREDVLVVPSGALPPLVRTRCAEPVLVEKSNNGLLD